MAVQPFYCFIAMPMLLAKCHKFVVIKTFPVMAAEPLFTGKDFMPRSECKRTAVCATNCRSRASKNSVPCRLSIRRNVQTVSIATTLQPTHDCYTNHILLNCKNILLYCGDSSYPQRQIAGGIQSATCNLSLRIKARTEHTCLKASGFSNVHA